MALYFHNGKTYAVLGSVRSNGEWMKVVIKDGNSKGRSSTATLWVKNIDTCGLRDGDTDLEVLVEDFGMSGEGERSGGALKLVEYPKGSGTWKPEVSFNDVILYRAGEANDSGTTFTAAVSMDESPEIEEAELPF